MGETVVPEQVPNREMTAPNAQELPVFGTFGVVPILNCRTGSAVSAQTLLQSADISTIKRHP